MNPGEHENPETQIPPSYGAPPPSPGLPGRIQWGVFFRLASPLAIVSGVASALFSPIFLLLVLPISLKRIISRYKPLHTGILQTPQGAAMGAFTAMLSFVAYLVIMLPVIAANRTPLLDIIRNSGAQNPGSQTAQLVSLVAFVLIVVLAVFLLTGAVSGVLLTRPKKLP